MPIPIKDKDIRRFVSQDRPCGPRGRYGDLGNITHSIHQPTEALTSAFIPSFKHLASLPISPLPDSSVAVLPQNDTHSHTHLCTTTVILSDCKERRISPCFLFHHPQCCTLSSSHSPIPYTHSVLGVWPMSIRFSLSCLALSGLRAFCFRAPGLCPIGLALGWYVKPLRGTMAAHFQNIKALDFTSNFPRCQVCSSVSFSLRGVACDLS